MDIGESCNIGELPLLRLEAQDWRAKDWLYEEARLAIES